MSGPNLQRQKLTIRAYRGQCLLCPYAIYEGDDIVRGRGQLLGVLHAGCARRYEASVEAPESHGEPRTGHATCPADQTRHRPTGSPA